MTHTLHAISPLDGRYATKADAIREHFSEYALIRQRFFTEVSWLIYMIDQGFIEEIDTAARQDLIEKISRWSQTFDNGMAEAIKAQEQIVKHDVKAVELFIRDHFASDATLKPLIPYIHFACTSEDINSTSYALMLKATIHEGYLPKIQALIARLKKMAAQYAERSMLARTHGQPASPTTMGKEFAVYLGRLNTQIKTMRNIEFKAKFSGAVGNFNAHHCAYRDKDWLTCSQNFLEGLGLTPNPVTTQIEPHDYIAEIMHCMIRINQILVDLCQDMWLYISQNYFILAKENEHQVGSSTMPHKVNPIDFENAEGNFSMSTAMAQCLAQKLTVSRLQRDLTDSTLLRNIGCAIAYSAIAAASLQQGLKKCAVNDEIMDQDLDQAWQVLAEAIHTVMRKNNHHDSYELLRKMTQSQTITVKEIHDLIATLDISAADREHLLTLTPHNYIGCAKMITDNLLSTLSDD